MNITWGLILTRDKASVLVGGRGCIFIHSCSVRLISFEVKAEPEYAPPQLTLKLYPWFLLMQGLIKGLILHNHYGNYGRKLTDQQTV